jgi:cytohesin
MCCVFCLTAACGQQNTVQTKPPASPHQDDEAVTGESGHGKGRRSSEAMTISVAASKQIHSLLEEGKLKQARKLLESQPQLVHARHEHNQRTPLHTASSRGQFEMVQFLVEHGADTNAKSGELPVSYFAIEHPEVLNVLLDAGADPKARVDTGNPHWGPYDSTLIREAAKKGVIDSVRLLLARGASVDNANTNGTTVLQIAALYGHVDIVKLLLDQGAKFGVENGGGWTAISLAADRIEFADESDQVEENARLKGIITLLLTKGQPLALFTAIALGRTEAVRSILKKKPELANSKTNSYDGKSALHRAVALNHKQIVAVLLDARADVNGSDWLGKTALHTAAYKGHVESAKLLIAHRADVNATDESGHTPLHCSAFGCRPAIGRLLLGAGANTNVKNNDGQIPLDAAKSFSDGDRHPQSKVKAMIRLLQKHQK